MNDIFNIKFYLIAIFVAMVIIGCSYNNYSNESKTVHISIDDVHISLLDLTYNEDKYNSIFDQQFFNILKSYNNEIGAKFTLYIFQYVGDWSIDDFPLKFKTELAENSSWLKFGFHSSVMGNPENGKNLFSDFEMSYNAVNRAIENFSSIDNISNILRLEYFFATDSIRQFLGGKNITLLSADSKNRISYSLPQDICDSIYIKGGFNYQAQDFCRTDFRLENMDLLTINKTLSTTSFDTVYIFTHELALGIKNRYKLHRVMNYFNNNGYKYIN